MQSVSSHRHRFLIWLSLMFLILFLSTQGTAHLSHASTPEFTLMGDAKLRGNGLRMTTTDYFQSSAAWLVDKQVVVDGFSVSFDWRFTRDTPDIGADGIAFVVQNASVIALGNAGYGIGYSGMANSLAIEFDTYQNVASEFEGPVDDPDDNHLSIQSRGGWLQIALIRSTRLATRGKSHFCQTGHGMMRKSTIPLAR